MIIKMGIDSKVCNRMKIVDRTAIVADLFLTSLRLCFVYSKYNRTAQGRNYSEKIISYIIKKSCAFICCDALPN